MSERTSQLKCTCDASYVMPAETFVPGCPVHSGKRQMQPASPGGKWLVVACLTLVAIATLGYLLTLARIR